MRILLLPEAERDLEIGADFYESLWLSTEHIGDYHVWSGTHARRNVVW